MLRRVLRVLSWVALATAAACDAGLAPAEAPTSCPKIVFGEKFVGICGTVTFQGATPDSTDGVFIVAYPTFPTSRADLFNFKPPPPLQSLAQPFVGPQFYTVQIPNGRYEWVVAVWKKLGPVVEDNLRAAGFYRDKADTSKAGVVIVNGIGTDSIDFVIDFDNMHPVSYFFLAAKP